MKPEFTVIRINAKTSFERGVQYGRQAKQQIQNGAENYLSFFESTGKSRDLVHSLAMQYVPQLEESMPEVLEEAKGIAAGAEISFEDLMVLNTRYELTNYPNKAPECTTAAVLPEAARDGKTYMIKNWDYKPAVFKNIVLLHILQEDGTRIFGLTEAGQMLREGFNSNGIGLCNNYIESIWDGPGVGIPVTFLRRRVLASKTYDEAFGWLTGIKRCVSNNMLLVSYKDRQAIDIEACPKGCDFIKPKAGIVTHANHFVVDPYKDRNDTWARMPKFRDTRLADLLYHNWGSIDVPYIQEIMKDHEHFPLSICCHSNNGMEDMRGLMTVASMIVDFEENAAYVCAGNPCEGEYQKYVI